MPSYNRFIILFMVLLVTSGCSESQINLKENKPYQKKSYALEDRDILFALELERRGDRANASTIYERLYARTNKDVYLLEYIKNIFNLKKIDELIDIVQKNKENINTKENEIYRIYIISLVQKQRNEEALNEAKYLNSKYKNDLNQELLGNIYLINKEYEKSKEIFEDLYERTQSETAVLNLSNILYVYENEKEEATSLLQEYVDKMGCTNAVCSKLLAIYQEDSNIDGIITLLKKTYYKFDKENNKFSRDRVYKLLIYYLESKNIQDAIAFLEESSADDSKLLVYYRSTNNAKKAYKLAQKLYEQTNNIDYLAQIAILEFETADDKREVLDSVIKKFEEVLSVLDNHIYQNYLGYLLIDYDIDVEKGLHYVKKALEKAPNNLAYLDSLAWGQYKLKECKSAYNNMKKVVDVAGLTDHEIVSHWYKIKECNK